MRNEPPKKKKSGGIAIPFLLTFLISLIIIGGAALIIYDKINSDDSSLEEMKSSTSLISDKDSHTVLLIADLSKTVESSPEDEDTDNDDEDEEDDEDYDDEDEDEDEDDEDEDEDSSYTEKKIYPEPYTFIIMRSVPAKKQLTFIGIPNIMTVGEREKTAEDVYITDGAEALKQAAGFTLGVNIDRYMIFDSEALQKTCSIFGGANFIVPGGIKGFSESTGEQYLGPQQMEKLISYGGFSNEIQRISTASSLITEMVNQTSGTRIADNLDNSFDTVVSMTKTDVSALDYQDMKSGIKFLFKYTEPNEDESRSARAKFITPYGVQTASSFEVDEAFIKDLQPYFEVTAEETKPSDSGLQEMIPETKAAKKNG